MNIKVKYAEQYLKRKFVKFSDEELEFSKVQLAHEINSTRLQLELINAEIERRHHE